MTQVISGPVTVSVASRESRGLPLVEAVSRETPVRDVCSTLASGSVTRLVVIALDGLGDDHRVPAQALLQPAEDRLRDPAEVPDELVLVLDVLLDHVRENVVLVHLRDLEAMLAEELVQ